MNNMRNKILMTLALLLTAVTGAWAQSTLNVVKLEVPAEWATDYDPLTATDLPGFKTSTLDETKAWTGAPATGNAILIYSFADNKTNLVNYSNGVRGSNGPASFTKDLVSGISATIYYTAEPEPADEPTEPAIDFKWDAETKTGTFTMPAFDVEIAPIYAPKAVFATDGNLVLTPTAIEGIYAESTDAIVKAGTVANIGETKNPQGTVMYAVTSTNQATAPALSAFSADVPTAKDIKVGSEVLVWYYIKGADTPDGEEATAENTFNDSEICATPIVVTVLSNKFDINFKAANDNTIEAGKATVTVGGTATTVTEGKLEGVKMGSEVKMTAKDGYKFRKVEAKKGGLLSIEIGGVTTATIYYVEGETWGQAIQNHPTENSVWKIDNGYISGNGVSLFVGDDFVSPDSTIDPKANYNFQWT